MTSNQAITFYDIASAPPLRTFAPNPWKTRFALNFKGVPYQTQWVDMPDITSLRETLGVSANRTHADGSPFHTLPVVHDASTGALLGDSFEIALYLDQTYSDGPSLFRPLSTGLSAAWNANVDTIFTKYIILGDQMPFDPRVQDAVNAIFAKRAAGMNVATLQLSPEQREGLFVGFEAALGELAKAYHHTGGTTDHFWRTGGTDKTQSQTAPPGRECGGPFLDGDQPAYADFIIGAWLKALESSMKPEDWHRVRQWQGGLWGRLMDALRKWSDIK